MTHFIRAQESRFELEIQETYYSSMCASARYFQLRIEPQQTGPTDFLEKCLG